MLVQHQLAQLRDALTQLSAEPEVQIEILPEGSAKADELALDFDDAFCFLPQLRKAGKVSERLESILLGINSRLETMSRNEALWSEKSLRSSIEWEEVRELAGNALRNLPEE